MSARPRSRRWAWLAGALAGFALLLMAAARDPRLGAYSVGGFAGASLVFAAVAWIAVRLLRRLVPEATRSPRWVVLATRAVAARPAFAVLQIAAMAIGLMALWVLVLLRTDLIDSWRASTPPDAPNRFIINVQPDQADAFRGALAQSAGVKDYDWFPDDPRAPDHHQRQAGGLPATGSPMSARAASSSASST